jgi:hypothetical protein
VGGNSRRSIRRAVERADGWLPFPAPSRMARRVRTAALESVDDLSERIAYARAHAASVGRDTPLDICFVPFGFQMGGESKSSASEFLAGCARLEALGVTWLTVAFPARSRREYIERVMGFGDEVLSKRS